MQQQHLPPWQHYICIWLQVDLPKPRYIRDEGCLNANPNPKPYPVPGQSHTLQSQPGPDPWSQQVSLRKEGHHHHEELTDRLLERGLLWRASNLE